MARNRKRAKERRARRPQGASVARPGVATAGLEAEVAAPPEAAPDPLQHASADAELAEAQMGRGRPERVEDSSNDAQPTDEAQPADDQEFGEGPEVPGVFPQRPRVEHAGPEEIETDAGPQEIEPAGAPAEIDRAAAPAEIDRAAAPAEIDRAAGPEEIETAAGPEEIEGGELEAVEAHAPKPRGRPGNRLVNFLLGSWRELQRVQWPDRRQVMQATGVVIGFVIVAGVFLGVADALAAQIVKFILK